MPIFYSRRTSVEEKRNIRNAFIFSLLSLGAVVAFIFLGLPVLTRILGFFVDLKKSSQPVDTSDTTPPPPPYLNPLPSSTNNASLEIKGNTEPGAIIILLLNNKESEVLANNAGEFSYNFSLKDGENTMTVTAKDSAGNISQKSETIKITFDNKPPDLEITKPAAKSEFFGAKQRQVVIEGKTEEGANININGRQVVVETDGSFSFATTLAEGENSFTIKSQDKAGNTTEKSLTVTFTP